MNKIGRIKLMTKSLSSKELYTLSKWCTEKARKRASGERIHEVIDLGVGGRVVYSTYHRQFDVCGKVGTIKKITKRKEHYYLEVEFDEPVWKTTTKVITKDFWKWYSDIADKTAFSNKLYDDYVAGGGKGKQWNMNNRLREKEYKRQTGKDAKEDRVSEGNVLIRIGPNSLKPATEENVERAERTKRDQPAFDNLNKMAQDIFKTTI